MISLSTRRKDLIIQEVLIIQDHKLINSVQNNLLLTDSMLATNFET